MTPPPTSASNGQSNTHAAASSSRPNNNSQTPSTLTDEQLATLAADTQAFTTPLELETPLSNEEMGAADHQLCVRCTGIPFETKPVRGYDFNEGINWEKIVDSYLTSGFQATAVGRAIDEINRMWRLSDEPIDPNNPNEILDPEVRRNTKCTIFLGYTSNMASSGMREIIRYLAQHRMIDCIVTTAGGIEEDFMKCNGDTYLGEFSLSGADLRKRGINRIGNLLLPNDNYLRFDDFIWPVLDQMYEEQQNGFKWTPSKFIDRLGKEIDNPDSIYYWCHKNNIPVFCPAITDGALGEILHFYAFEGTPLNIDVVPDICLVEKIAIRAKRSGMIIVGAGVAKHHISNANLKRGGADYAVYINTAQEFDGCDSGARPDEAVSWGKIRPEATPVKVYGEATLVLPIIVGRTFARAHQELLVAAKAGQTVQSTTSVQEKKQVSIKHVTTKQAATKQAAAKQNTVPGQLSSAMHAQAQSGHSKLRAK
ncbi:DHS-like NAD/FAD-binding domain-containing protein [Thamnocephalis sphaerospora]|uniref:deoxyhypusine synthase n=1 Tax=Thamnocephalis sphaerospora TaxID=78915 RepID=A0A4P9XQA1_9FUNG|nr:DHS-like NAD/FAD-binding domain-containing protein [Thamnocephalis sphaerospora]|eukprot:RKP08206.1 DHS-like NAD/FAD-binding domain-containing protein [Thamnocephalis sphaerospora]